MVNYKSRIEKMVADGALSKEQATKMQKSISEIQTDSFEIEPIKKRLPTSLVMTVGGGALLAALIASAIVSAMVSGGEPQTEIIQNVSETLNTAGEVGKMSNSQQSLFLGIAIIGVPLLVCIVSIMFIYNGLIGKEENVLSSWAQVESNLQRRADLIPNLVTSIKTYMEHEKDVLDDVTGNRSGGLSEVVSALEDISENGGKLANLSDKATEKLSDDAFMKALATEQQQIGSQVNKLMGVVENYPELRSSDQFLALQAQLEGTENRINVTRMVFNDVVGEYNASIRKIPGSFVAGMGDFKRKAYFQAEQDTKHNAKIEM